MALPLGSNFVYVKYALVKIGYLKFLAGRPETHPVKKIVGFDEAMIAAVEVWRAAQRPVPNQSEAIRRLIALALAADRPAPKPSRKTAARAAELAAKVIDKHTDGAPEAAVRKRRLVEGPSMVRGVRKDR